MRRLSLAFAAVFALAGAAAHAENLSLAAGQAVRIGLSGPVHDVVVGDPTVADVSVVNERTLVVMGKRAGMTSVMAFDAAGRALSDRQVVVAEAGGAITVYRGVTPPTNYACGEQCARLSPRIGN